MLASTTDEAQIAGLVIQLREQLAAAQKANAGLQQQLGDAAASLAAEKTTHAATAAQLGTVEQQLVNTAAALEAEKTAHAASVDQVHAVQQQLADTVAALAAEKTSHAQTAAECLEAERQVDALTGNLGAVRDQVAELQAKYEASPASGSGIVVVMRWQTSDGALHASLPEAQRAAAIAGVEADLGVTAAAAEVVVDRRDRLLPHFAVADAAAAAVKAAAGATPQAAATPPAAAAAQATAQPGAAAKSTAPATP
jgi:hypothetical protein